MSNKNITAHQVLTMLSKIKIDVQYDKCIYKKRYIKCDEGYWKLSFFNFLNSLINCRETGPVFVYSLHLNDEGNKAEGFWWQANRKKP